MPPWKFGNPGTASSSGARRSATPRIATIERWVEDGAREGDPRDLPPPPQWTDGWQLGTP
jgi:hypothetical protein